MPVFLAPRKSNLTGCCQLFGNCSIVRQVAMDPRIEQAMGLAEIRVPLVLRTLKAARHLRDQDIAQHMGMTRSAVQARMAGKTQCSPGELAGFALVFGVPVEVFYEPPKWVIGPLFGDGSENLETPSRCTAFGSWLSSLTGLDLSDRDLELPVQAIALSPPLAS